MSTSSRGTYLSHALGIAVVVLASRPSVAQVMPSAVAPPPQRIVLDLRGDGLDLARCDAATKRRSLPSAGGDDRLLAIDVTEAAKAGYRITAVSGMQGRFLLFGSGIRVTLPRGATSEPDTGWALLTLLETTRDGVLDKNDLLWPALGLARDENGDGVLDSTEVETLAASAVAGVGPRTPAISERDRHGNELAFGSFARTDRTAGRMADVALAPCEK